MHMLPTLIILPLYFRWLNAFAISTLPLGSSLSSTQSSENISSRLSQRLLGRMCSRANSTMHGSQLIGNSHISALTARRSFTSKLPGSDGRTSWFAIKSKRPMTSVRSTWFRRMGLPYLRTNLANTFRFNASSRTLASTNPDSKLVVKLCHHAHLIFWFRYSLSDAPNSDHFRISVRRERGSPSQEHPGCLSNLLHDGLNQGDTVEVAFPFGDFFLDDSAAPVVLLSAGVGLTPLISMLHSILATPKPREVSWVQVVHSQNKHALNDEVRQLLKQHPTPVRKTIFYSEPGNALKGEHYDIEGRMDLAKVDDLTLRLGDDMVQYYICGPESFMADTGKALLARGVEHSRIHAEVFGGGAIPI